MPTNLDNQLSGADACVMLLEDYGVEVVFGLCGDTSLGLYDSFYRLKPKITHILTRDERHAGYMAEGYAKVSGRVGVCEGPSGGGATYILPGLVEANESSIPILALTTDVGTSSWGRFPLTELDQKALFKPVTKWNDVVEDVGQLPFMLNEAFHAMTHEPYGSAHLALPFDVLKQPIAEEEVSKHRSKRPKQGLEPCRASCRQQPTSPDSEMVGVFADRLVASRRAVIICGGGPHIAGAYAELEDLAKLLDIPVATSVSGQGVIAETSPYALGVVGTNGGHAAIRAVIEAADTILMIGCRAGSVTTEKWQSPHPDQEILHIDCDPGVLGRCYEKALTMCADAKCALQALLSELASRNDLKLMEGRARAKQAWQEKWDSFQELATREDGIIRPERVLMSLQSQADDDAIICADPGTPCPYVSAFYRWRKRGRHFISNRAHGALGYALAAAVGAYYARPEAQIFALMGDGSFGFCCGELETLLRYRIPVKCIVFNNASFGWIKAGQKAGFNEHYYNVDFTRTDHGAIASAFGLRSWRVEKTEDLEPVLAQAAEYQGPCLVDIYTQPLQEAKAPVSAWIA